MNTLNKLSFLLVLLTVSTKALAIEESATPRALIKDATEQLVEALQANRDQIRQDRTVALQIANEIALPIIDFPGASRSVLGRHWRTATQDQRERFTRAFRRKLESVYVTAMINYSDDIVSAARNISYPNTNSGDNPRLAVVKTVIHLQSGVKASVDYKLHRVGDSWKVFDVSILGISLAKTYRYTFARELRRRGLDGLIAKLENRNDATIASSSGG